MRALMLTWNYLQPAVRVSWFAGLRNLAINTRERYISSFATTVDTFHRCSCSPCLAHFSFTPNVQIFILKLITLPIPTGLYLVVGLDPYNQSVDFFFLPPEWLRADTRFKFRLELHLQGRTGIRSVWLLSGHRGIIFSKVIYIVGWRTCTVCILQFLPCCSPLCRKCAFTTSVSS